MITFSANDGKYGPRMILHGPGMIRFYSAAGGNPVVVPNEGTVIGGGVPNRVIEGGVPNRVVGGGVPNRVLTGGRF